MAKDIKFSENCYRYIIKFVSKTDDGNVQISYLHYRGQAYAVRSTINIWASKTFFSIKEAQEMLDECKRFWPECNGTICKVYMSAPEEV